MGIELMLRKLVNHLQTFFFYVCLGARAGFVNLSTFKWQSCRDIPVSGTHN